jgi:type I restriction enzyme S subunit
MFTRIWAQDSQYGLPYLNATDLMSYFALGVPAQERYLSRASNVKMDQLIVKKEMILMTCSGTLGRVFDVPPDLDGWAGTHDIVRITPHDPELKGFLRAYLASSFAQVQILSHTHGGQIDHITGDQIASCLVPSLDTETISRISKLAVKADKMRSNGVKQMNDVLSDLAEVFGRG